MTKWIHICDKCKKEVDWLYEIPFYHIDGKVINAKVSNQELCKKCAQELVDTINNYSKE